MYFDQENSFGRLSSQRLPWESHHMHRGAVLGRIDPRLFDSHARSSSVGVSAALAGSGGRGMVGSPQDTLVLNVLVFEVRYAFWALFTRFHSSGGAKSHASKEG